MIVITLDHLNQIHKHALKIYPEECCGLLLGTIKDKQKTLIEVFPAENSWTPEENELFPKTTHDTQKILSKQNRFSIAPEVVFNVQKEARSRQLQIIGVYHSHPDYIAVPSEFDRAIAWAEYSYIIVSVTSNNVIDLKTWQLDNTKNFRPEALQIIKVNS